jgi:fucose permease
MPTHSPRFIAGLAMLCLGFFDGVLGVAWLSIHSDLSVPLESLGWVLGAVGIGSALGSAIFPSLVRLQPHLNLLWICLAGQALVFFLVILSNAYWMFVVLYSIRGIANGVAHAALNAFFAQRISSHHLMNIHGGWGVGTASAGLLSGLMIASGLGWESIYLLGGLLSLVAMSAVFVTRHNFHHLDVSLAISESGAFRMTVPIAFAVVSGALYVGLEQGVGNWVSSILVATDGASIQQAGVVTGLFWGGLTLGRFTLTRIPGSTVQMLRWASTLIAVILVVLIFLPKEFKFMAYAMLGFAMAPMSAFILTAGASLVPVEKRDLMMAIQVLSFSAGAAMVPTAFGGVAAITSIAAVPIGFVGVSLLLICSIWITVKR